MNSLNSILIEGATIDGPKKMVNPRNLPLKHCTLTQMVVSVYTKPIIFVFRHHTALQKN